MRIDKNNYYLNIAEEVAKRGTCLRTNYGAVIVKNDEVISTGYTGSPRDRINCCDLGKCKRIEMNTSSGDYTYCRSVHAEMNAIISASRNEMIGSTLYLVGLKPIGEYKENADSCSMCKRLIINAGIETIIIRDTEEYYRIINVMDWIKKDDTLF